jgi:hypothetical protein
LPNRILFIPKDGKKYPCGHSVCAVNLDNKLIALGWIDNKVVNFISTLDTTEILTVPRRIHNEKVELPELQTDARYNQFMGGVDKHDKLCSTLSLGK